QRVRQHKPLACLARLALFSMHICRTVFCIAELTARDRSMTSMLINREDLDFLLFDLVQAETLVTRDRYAEHSADTFRAIIEAAHTLAEEKFAPHNRKADENEPTFDGERVHMIPEVAEAVKAFADGGFMAAPHDEEWGGMQLPITINQACLALFRAANVGSSAYSFLTSANAN